MNCVLGVDPGTSKYGLAVVSDAGECLMREVVPAHQFETALSDTLRRYQPSAVVLGDRTGASQAQARLQAMLQALGSPYSAVPIEMVAEHMSSVEGRRRYLLERKRGWRRLIPIGLQTPDAPFDHYVAEVLARRYLSDRSEA